MRRASAIIIVLTIATVSLASGGCDSANHDNIDKWLSTQKGLGKLDDAMRDSSNEIDLRGHAAVNLIRKQKDDKVYAYIGELQAETRATLVKAMVPRLWALARLEGEKKVPSPLQTSTKDALFVLRKHADDATTKQIDAHLLDWLTGGYYAGRAESGAVRGELIIRALSDSPSNADRVADSMIAALNAIIAAPANDKGGVRKIDETLLLGLAVTGSPKATAKLLEVAGSPALAAKHKQLERRIMVVLEHAFVDPDGRFEKADPRGIYDKSVFPTIVQLAKDETRSNTVASIAINLVRAAGLDHGKDHGNCLTALVGMISHPHSHPRYKWIVAKRALDCGQIKAIGPVANAFSGAGAYAEINLRQVLVEPMVAMTPRADVAKNARILLSSDTWVARLVGLEVLGRLGLAKAAAQDAAAIRKLTRDKARLKGYWGDQADVPKRKRKKLPTLGSRASQVAKSLEELAKGSTK